MGEGVGPSQCTGFMSIVGIRHPVSHLICMYRGYDPADPQVTSLMRKPIRGQYDYEPARGEFHAGIQLPVAIRIEPHCIDID